MGQTVVEKVAQAHMTSGPKGRQLRAGDFVSIRPKHVLTHDNTSSVIKKFTTIGAKKVFDPRQPVFVLDHDIQNTTEENLGKYKTIEDFAKEHKINFYPAQTGIGHQIMCEQLYVTPGAFVVASDSHANMYGALGAIGSPVVRTDAAAIWSTGEFWWQIPKTVQVTLQGKLPAGVCGKDVIILLCGLFNHAEVLNQAVEFSGPGVESLTIDDRLSIANMTTEWGALTGWFQADATALAYIRERLGRGAHRVSEIELKKWAQSPLRPDSNAEYAARITLDLSSVTPHVAGPDAVGLIEPLASLAPKRVAVQKAYLLSCVSARLSDLRAAARVLNGEKVAPSVKLYVAAASKEIQQQAETEGVWKSLLAAGAIALPPGCGACIGLGAGLLKKGEVGISASNRNFKGRMGDRDAICYLASPQVVAASAVAGFICGPTQIEAKAPISSYNLYPSSPLPDEEIEIMDKFPMHLAGRLVYVPKDNLNTDGIYGKEYTYRDDLTAEDMAKVVMENYDPQFASQVSPNDILVGGDNFGTGSSREQAVTALKAKGLRVLVAASFSQTYQRNAFNNGVACIEAPDLVSKLKEILAEDIQAGRKTIIPGDQIAINFKAGTINFRKESFRFASLGSVPQGLIVAMGIENQVRKMIGIA